MKKTILIALFTLVVGVCNAQEWFTSFDVAKRLALVQNKMLFVVWEESLIDTYPLLFKAENGNLMVVDLSVNDGLDPLIWEHFVPVLLPESEYVNFINKAKDRGVKYIDKLNDDSIKIMDVNGNILNIKEAFEIDQNLSEIIKKYALNTSFLNLDFRTYIENVNLTSAFNLASKYYDYAIFVVKEIRPEVIELANIYFEEAKKLLDEGNLDNKEAIAQRLNLFDIKAYLILDNPRKALRHLKKFEESEIAEINKSFFSFLEYTTFKLLNDDENAALWENKVSQLDLKKAELIININKK